MFPMEMGVCVITSFNMTTMITMTMYDYGLTLYAVRRQKYLPYIQ